jgi:hypothetical protein
MTICSYAQGTIITEAPEGETKTYTRTGKAFASDGLKLVDIQNSDMTVVTTDDGDVYIQNPVSELPMGTWVKGHKDGNTISIPTRQTVYTIIDDLVLDIFELKNGTYTSTGEAEITFTIEEDGKLVLNGTNADGSRIMGLGGTDGFNEPDFRQIGDCAVVCTPKEEAEETGGIPEDAVSKQYTLEASNSKGETTGAVTVYRSGNKVFFEGLFSEEAPGLIATGTIDADGNVTFTKGQLIGSFYGLLPLYLIGSNANLTGDPYDIEAAAITDITDVVFTYDPATDTYTLKTPSIILNGSADEPDLLAYYTTCVLKPDATGISAPVTGNNTKEAVTYYDITGKRIAQPTRGLVIKKIQQADGTTKTTKMLLK